MGDGMGMGMGIGDDMGVAIGMGDGIGVVVGLGVVAGVVDAGVLGVGVEAVAGAAFCVAL